MADSREIGMRVGAAANQAAEVVGSLVFGGYLTNDAIVGKHLELTQAFLGTMQSIQSSLEGAPATQPVAIPASVPVTVPQPDLRREIAESLLTQAFGATPAPSTTGYNTTFSGSNKPLKLVEHPELDAWLHQQCAAVGVKEVWDNRGKPNFISAVNEGKAKTPPPFRSATEGIDKSFWPPNS